jgi:hypothetical protein
MSGWDFLKEYDTYSNKIKDKIRLFVVTASIGDRDKIRARMDHNVVDCLERPLSPTMVSACTATIVV